MHWSKRNTVEIKFEGLLHNEIKANFTGTVNYFLGQPFHWPQTRLDTLKVYMNPAVFLQKLADKCRLTDANFDPFVTTYRSGLYVNTFRLSTFEGNDPQQLRLIKKINSSSVISINSRRAPAWTCPPPSTSKPHTETNHPWSTSRLLPTPSATSALWRPTASVFLPNKKTDSSIFFTPPFLMISRRTKMPSSRLQ